MSACAVQKSKNAAGGFFSAGCSSFLLLDSFKRECYSVTID